MKIYIAASSHKSERARVDKAFEAIKKRTTYEITYDWRPSVDSDKPNFIEAAQNDFVGVLDADVVWYLIPDSLSTGSHTELGIALGYRSTKQSMLVIASGNTFDNKNIFVNLCDFIYSSDGSVIDYLCEKMT